MRDGENQRNERCVQPDPTRPTCNPLDLVILVQVAGWVFSNLLV
jgi:hypothetical protein